MIKVYLPSIRHSAPDDRGARLEVIGETETLTFEGEPAKAANYLKFCIPVGQPVAVRYPGGLRSCMNKPGLWADIRAMED